MRLIAAGKAIWHGAVLPQRVQEATTQAATATFAVAVLLVVVVSVWSAMIENGDATLAVESQLLTQTTAVLPADTTDLDM